MSGWLRLRHQFEVTLRVCFHLTLLRAGGNCLKLNIGQLDLELPLDALDLVCGGSLERLLPQDDGLAEDSIILTLKGDFLFQKEDQARHRHITVEVQNYHQCFKKVGGLEGGLLEGDICPGASLVEAAPAGDPLLTHLHHQKFEVRWLLRYRQTFLAFGYQIGLVIDEVDDAGFHPVFDLSFGPLRVVSIVQVDGGWAPVGQQKLKRDHIEKLPRVRLTPSLSRGTPPPMGVKL